MYNAEKKIRRLKQKNQLRRPSYDPYKDTRKGEGEVPDPFI